MKTTPNSRIFAAMFAAYVAAIAAPGPARAETADLSNVPLANSPSDAVLPNLMYILDDSGSMQWDYMPDNIQRLTNGTELKNCKDSAGTTAGDQCANSYGNGAPDGNTSTWGEPPFYSAQFNQIYYNPDIYYAPPVDQVGASLGDSNYTGANRDGYLDATASDLSKQYADVYYCVDNSATFVGYIGGALGITSSKVLTVTAMTSGVIQVGDRIRSSSGMNSPTLIESFGSGTGGIGTYNVTSSQARTPRTITSDMPTTPANATLADTNFCRRNGINNKEPTHGYFLYWSNSATNGAYPNNNFKNRRPIYNTGGHYYTISAHEYCSDVNLTSCALATAAGASPGGSNTIPAPVRYCKTTSDAASTSAISGNDSSGNAKCRSKFDTTKYPYPRYGRFKRVNLDQATYTKSTGAVRPDCALAATCTLDEEKKNFANWYTWYRTRMAMMKTATGRAFVDINDRYRVGFITINYKDTNKADTYLPIAKFEADQKKAFYQLLYKQVDHGGTPLRQALSRVGRHYAGKTDGINTGMAGSPITHDCQQNFSLLTTDGYWTDTGDPADINGNLVGNQDVTPTVGAPVYVSRATGTIDGANSKETVNSPYLLVEQAKCTANNSIPFGEITGTTRLCGCGANEAGVWQRTLAITRSQKQTAGEPTTGITETETTGAGASVSFTQVVACTPQLITTTETPYAQTEYNVCTGSSNSTFSPAGSPQVACGCSSGRKRIVQRVRNFTRTNTLIDGITQGSPVTDSATTSYGTPGNYGGSGGSCTNSSISAPSTTTAAATGAAVPKTTNGGTNLVSSFVPQRTANGDPVTMVNTAGGTTDTLADVAMYYYKTDLRTDLADKVPTTDKDVAEHQHMVTFTLGLGLKGEMDYIANYENSSTGDFAKIKNADIGACSWIVDTGQRCDWPVVSAGGSTTLDDLWHTAVNGRGVYYSASDPNSVADSLTSALTALKVQTAAASASATSSPNITETENFIYSSTFRTVKWDGEVVAQRIDSITGNVIPAVEWSAQQQLDTRILAPGDKDNRMIYTFEPGAGDLRKEFFYDKLTGTIGGKSEQSWFLKMGVNLSQYAGLTSGQKDIADDGTNMVNYLRGQYQYEGTVYRDRDHVLGDPINATPAFIGKPRFAFNDSGAQLYADFKLAQIKRQGMLYIAANDGMLHALNGDTGNELWAYVPRIVFPKLHLLATDQWSVNHEYNTDGSPQIMDMYDTVKKEWRTILVAGLNKGGRGYYALDITNPTANGPGPLPLWEICADKEVCENVDDDIGFTYGNPVITKRASDGKWVVLVTSGMNNVSPGTGRGFLYVLDALTGKILEKVEATDGGGATEGDTATPSGFAKISAFANDFNTDNTATYVYGGDLFGNLWRFDMSASPPKVMKMAELKDKDGNPQSVTSRPELGVIEGNRVVFVGTGRYLGQSDLSDPATLDPKLVWAYQQTMYAIKDKDAQYGDVRKSSPGLVEQTLSDTKGVRSITSNPVKWGADDGWFVDFNPGDTSPGERVNLDPQLILGTLVVTTNVPNKNACSTGGDSFIYQFNYASGTNIGTAGGAVAQKFTGQITVGVVIVRLPSGVFKGISTGATGTKTSVGVNLGSGGSSGRRVSWRELIQ